MNIDKRMGDAYGRIANALKGFNKSLAETSNALATLKSLLKDTELSDGTIRMMYAKIGDEEYWCDLDEVTR